MKVVILSDATVRVSSAVSISFKAKPAPVSLPKQMALALIERGDAQHYSPETKDQGD